MKTAGDDGNAAMAPSITEPSGDSQCLGNSGDGGFNGQQWLTSDHSLPIMTPSSGATLDKGGPGISGFGGAGGESQGTSGSQDGMQSNKPTPNSSTAGGSGDRMHLAPGQLNGSGHNSFQTSPISPHQTMMNPGMLGGSTQGFFADSSGFTMPTTLDHNGVFTIPDNWGDIHEPTGVTPVGEGVLRALMNMGPMDAMDLSPWETRND